MSMFSHRNRSPASTSAPSPAAAAVTEPVVEVRPISDLLVDLKVRLHQQLIDVIDPSAIEKMPRDRFEAEVGEIVREMLKSETALLNAQERQELVPAILDEMLGLGPLEPLLKDHTVSDIIVNTHRQVVVERRGKIDETPIRFRDAAHVLRIINKIVAAVGRRVDEGQPIVDARLADGSRVNAVIPPCAVDGPLLSIRKFSHIPFDLDLLVTNGTITPEMRVFLDATVRSKLNILISGGTGSGKTTLLNAMSRSIGARESVITIEDAAELQLQQRLVRRLETRPPNLEGHGEITQRDLLKAALRMRPDRIIVGEVRGGEAFDMMQAMNTGHEGSMSTIHANTPRDALSRLEQMVGQAGINMSNETMRQQIASAIHVVIQIARASDGKRRLVSLHEITGMESEVITSNEIFHFRRTSIDGDGNVHGYFEALGIRPKFVDSFASQGVVLPDDLFAPHRQLQ
jgi:pilus assembly protein CpaF